MAVLPIGISGEESGYQIERSLRFNSADSAYLSRTPASSGTSATVWTFSWWQKGIALNGLTQVVFGAESGGARDMIRWDGSGTLEFYKATSAIRVLTPKYRDPSAWYHFVINVSGTTVGVYVNGVQVTAFTTSNNPSGSWYIGQAYAHRIGVDPTGGDYLSGYLTEVNFIDGQALDPTSFGEYNSETGVWQPKAYTGSYGTNGFYLPMTQGESYSGYFSSAYVNTPTDASFALTTNQFAIEWWEYRTSTSNVYPVWGGKGQATYDPIVGYLDSGNNVVYMSGNGSSWGILSGFNVGSVNVGQWNHFLLTRDSSNVVRGFKNGVLTSNTNIGASSIYMSANGLTIGRAQSSNYFLGYVSNARVCIGAIPTAYQTSSTTNGTTIFTPSTTQLTTTSQGATSSDVKLLTMQNSTIVDNSANAWSLTTSNVLTQEFSPFYLDVTDDHSGNGNNWTPNNLNLSTSGSGADIMVDTPTPYGTDTGVGGEVRGNYATLNPIAASTNLTFSNGNLQVVSASSSDLWCGQGTMALTYPVYMEGQVIGTHSTGSGIGIYDITQSLGTFNGNGSNVIGVASTAYAMTFNNGSIKNSNSVSSYGSAFSAGDTWMMAFDPVNGKIWWGKNGTWFNSGNPATGTNPAYSGITGTKIFGYSVYSTGVGFTYNAGQLPFAYTAPSGFKALCTQNLPEPTVVDGGEYFNAVLWTGNGSTQTITTGIANDLVWTKDRGALYDHTLFDAVRGATKFLRSNDTTTEETRTDSLTAFTSTGFSVGADSVRQNINKSGNAYVSWAWKAGGTGVSNTDGTITSAVVSANTTAGFSIVTYTSPNLTADQTVGHGLGVEPSFIIVKNRTGFNWDIYHKSLGYNASLTFTTSGTRSGAFGSTINNTVFTTKDNYTHYSTNPYVAYCFAPVEGYSAFGSYTGNGSSDGPFVYTGFRPAYVLIKASSIAGENWYVVDATRSPYNAAILYLSPNSSGAESSPGAAQFFDFLSNGFKLRVSGSYSNSSGATYIYAAFAENPFKYSLAR